jgi:hypothetical protein
LTFKVETDLGKQLRCHLAINKQEQSISGAQREMWLGTVREVERTKGGTLMLNFKDL